MLNSRSPETAADAALPVRTVTTPLLDDTPYPLTMLTTPDVRSVAVVVPARMDTSPPSPGLVVPTAREMEPAAPDLAAPVNTVMSPELPLAVVPDANTKRARLVLVPRVGGANDDVATGRGHSRTAQNVHRAARRGGVDRPRAR